MTYRPPLRASQPIALHRLCRAATAMFILTAAACDNEPSVLPPTPLASELQRVLDLSVAKPGVVLPGAIAYYKDSAHQPWSGAAGQGDLSSRIAMRGHDRFRAGSVLKTLLATVVLQHVESGALSLDAKLPTLLAEPVTAGFPQANQISLRMLLNHTSGIPEWVNDEVHARAASEPSRVWSADEALAIAAAQPPAFAPGTAWGYSNTNYTLVGLILDRVGGKSWRQQVRERVIDRLGLAGTTLPEPGDTTLPGDYAHGYHAAPGGILDLTAVDPSMAGAAGGHALVTTAPDLARFVDALLAGQLFTKSETLTAMTTMIDAPHESGLPHHYGLGLETFTMPNGTRVIGHSGSTAGYAVMMFRIPGQDATLITAVNTTDLFANALQIFIPALDVITGRPG